MGNIQTLIDMSDEELDKEIEQNPMLKMMICNDEMKKHLKKGLKSEATKKLFLELEEIGRDTKEKLNEISKKYVTPVYEGSCGINLKDDEAQKILDKYFPRTELNQHAKDMLIIFQTWSFKQLRETPDRYPESSFWSSPLYWLFMADDPDFQSFLTKDGPLDVENIVTISEHDKTITREVMTYLKTKCEK